MELTFLKKRHYSEIGLSCAISRRRVFAPIFFEESVTVARYQNMLQEFIDQLDPKELQNGYFQHDRAVVHAAQTSLNF